jgi:hypothetical protein
MSYSIGAISLQINAVSTLQISSQLFATLAQHNIDGVTRDFAMAIDFLIENLDQQQQHIDYLSTIAKIIGGLIGIVMAKKTQCVHRLSCSRLLAKNDKDHWTCCSDISAEQVIHHHSIIEFNVSDYFDLQQLR